MSTPPITVPLLIAAASLLVGAALRASPARLDADALGSSPEALRVLTLGHESAHATLLWMHIVDRFAAGEVDSARIAHTLRTIGDLDPGWAEPWFFGILMLGADDHALRQVLIDEAAVLHPTVPWFAWRAGMSRLGDNREVALTWLEKAASAPGADPAYRELLTGLQEAR